MRLLARSVLAATVLALLAAPTLAVVPAASAAARPDYSITAPSRFSPNGDRVKDVLPLRYTLPRRMRVRLEIGSARGRTILRRVNLGERSAGTHTWRWNGRNQSGRIAADGRYRIRLVTSDAAGLPVTLAQEATQLDTSFAPTLLTSSFGAPHRKAPRVFPRTKVVRDALSLTAAVGETKVERLRLKIRTKWGRVVRSVDVNAPWVGAAGDVTGRGKVVGWTARKGGKPLPRGRYTAVLTGRDRAGNSGRSKSLRIFVSADKLVWREESRKVTPDATVFGPCTYSSANGCGDFPDCGEVVPSTLFVGGLSHRSALCVDQLSPLSRAWAPHLLEVPEATGVRGLAAVRVAFTGAPTHPGATDVGTLRVWGVSGDSQVVGTSGTSAWVTDPTWGEGDTGERSRGVPSRAPAAAWGFETTGTDSVDVASYTVDVRYLAVAG